MRHSTDSTRRPLVYDPRKQVAHWLNMEPAALERPDFKDFKSTVPGWVEWIDAEGVSGLLWQRLQQLPPATVPAWLAAGVAQNARHQVARQLTADHALRQLAEPLSRAGLEPVLFKGAALAHTFYDSPALRPRCDADLFIPRDALRDLEAILAAHGYRRGVEVSGPAVMQQFSMWKHLAGYTHVLDIHVELTNAHLFQDLVTYPELRAQAIWLSKVGFPVPEPAYALLLACMHRSAHHHNTDRLIWLYDIHRLLCSLTATGQRRFAELACEKRIASICAQGIATCVRFFPTPFDTEAARLLYNTGPERSADYLRPRKTLAGDLWLNLRHCPNWSTRRQLVAQTLFPPASYLRQQHARARGAWLTLYYLKRILKGAAKYTRHRDNVL